MLVFIDESEWPRPATPGGFTVWAAIGVPTERQREFFREIFNLEKKFWKSNEPYDFELKGRLLLSKKGMTSPKKKEFVEEILSLCKSGEVVAFAVGLRYPSIDVMEGVEPNTYRVISALCERVETMTEEQRPNETAAMVFDSQEDNKAKALEFGNYTYGTIVGRGMTHVVSTPLFVSSLVTKGVQIADLFAYALAQQSMGRFDVNPFCDRIRELEWKSSDKQESRPWRGFYFRDVPIEKEEGIGDPSRSSV